MSPRLLAGLGIASFLLFLLVRLPLGTVTGDALPAQVVASGSFWNGALDGIRIPASPPARLHVRGRPLSLLALGVAADWHINALTLRAGGRVRQDLGGTTTLTRTNMALDLSGLALPLPLVGTLKIEIEALKIAANGRCLEARGTARTDTLTRSLGAYDWTGPQLEGPLLCDNGQARLMLTGRAEATDVALNLTLASVNVTEAEITIHQAPAGLAFALTGAGFAYDSDNRLAWRTRQTLF